jgi:diguanylate cyclase (GGDEF)-like protein
MAGIDPRTVLLLTGALGGFMAVVLYLLRRNYPPAIRGIGEWALSMALGLVAGLLFTAVGKIPVLLSVTLPTIAYMAAAYISYMGTQRFFGVVPKPLPWIIWICLAVLGSTWFLFVDPSYSSRLRLNLVVMVSLFVAQGNLIYQKSRHSYAGRTALIILAIATAIHLMRLVSTFFYPVGSSVMDPSLPSVVYITVYSFLVPIGAISQVIMATERLRAELEHVATHDSLTDAYTRRYMNEAIQRELERCTRHGRSMSLMLLDIDHFKSVNDVLGHQAGDQVLVQLVARTNQHLRSADLLGRLGGEEFVVLLPETSLDVATVVAERIRMGLAETTGPTVSIGITTNRAEGDTVDTLLARADAAMYRAKNTGRNRVEVA